MEVEYSIRNKYIKNLGEDLKRRKELNVLHVVEAPSPAYKSTVTGKRMLWYIDPDKCTGCKQCVAACSLAKTGRYVPEESRIYVKRVEPRGWSIPLVCEHCVDAPCADICPVYAISRDVETGIVSVDLGKCIGCRLCRYVCPWGKETIQIREVEGFHGLKAVKCDLCGGDPACAKVCTAGALQWVEFTGNSELKQTTSKVRARDIAAMNVEGCI